MKKILVVEDERSVRQAICFELEDNGYEVIYASNYQEAVVALKAFQCDAVISDLFLGKDNGIQLLNIINGRPRKVPFIAITAFPESELATQARLLLKDCFLEKPFSAPILIDKVQQLLACKVNQIAVG